MWRVRKLAFALKFRCCNLRNLFGLLCEAAIFSEFKSKILFLSKVILCIVKMGLTYHRSRVAKYTMFESLWLLNLDRFQLSFCLCSWQVLWNGSNAMKPMWQDGEIRACFQPVFRWAEAHWVQPGGVALQPNCHWDLCRPWEPSTLPAASEHSRAFNTLASASWQILNEKISLQVALVSKNLFRASGVTKILKIFFKA